MNIFKNTQFLKLWGNQILLQIAFNMCNFTALLMLDNTTHSRFTLAQFYAAMTLPAFLVGIFAGSIVDISNRKRLMLITDLALSLLFLGYALFANQHALLLTIAFLSAAVAQFFTPAEAATIPIIVKEDQLEQANAVFLFTGLGSVMLGYIVAGPVIQLFGGLEQHGPQAAFMVASLLTFIGFLLRLSLKTIETAKPELINSQIFQRTLALTREVLKQARSNRRISLPIILLTLMEFNIGLLAILFIDYVKRYLMLPTTSTSYYLVIPLVAGLALGVTILGKVQQWISRGQTILLAAVAFGLIILTLGILPKLTDHYSLNTQLLRMVTVAGAALIGVAAVFISVHARTVLQENTPTAMLGRVFSLVTISAAAVTPIPILLVALLTEKVDVTTIFIIFGGFLLAIALLLKKPLQQSIH